MSRTAATAAGRAGRPWRRVQSQVFSQESACWLCGRWVDQTLPTTHPYARTADHLVQLCHGGDPQDRSNLRLAHMACNSGRSNSLRRLPVERCACSQGLPCAVLVPDYRRGLVSVDVSGI